jgi:hypothetical protein
MVERVKGRDGQPFRSSGLVRIARRLAAQGRLNRRHGRLFATAVLALARANTLLRWRPFERALRFGAVPLRQAIGGVAVEDVVWAVRAAARRVPFRAMCIEQGLAAQRMMRRAGIDARLHYGARQGNSDEELTAHVWVTVQGEIVLGGEEASQFAEVAAFP